MTSSITLDVTAISNRINMCLSRKSILEIYPKETYQSHFIRGSTLLVLSANL